MYAWYDKRRLLHAVLSVTIRAVAGLLLVAGVLLPLVSSSNPPVPISLGGLTFSGPAQLGVACVALAGLVIGANHVFMISSTWARFAGTMMKLETLRQISRLEWNILKLSFADPPVTADEIAACTHFKTMITAGRQIVDAETSTWNTELGKAMEYLDSAVRDQRTALDNLAKEERKKLDEVEKATLGSLRVKLAGQKQRLTGEITLQVGTEKRTTALADQFAFISLPVGPQKITLTATDTAGKAVVLEEVVQISATTISDITFTIPS